MRRNKNSEDTMRVSFDLDEVLFVNPATHKTEPKLMFPFNLMFKERLRLGTPELINTLQKMGYEVWVYTSSYRSEFYIKTLFACYGVKFDSIVNAQRHLREVQQKRPNILPQKVPSYYKIKLHIDDETVICSYGREMGFDAYQLDAEDDSWKEKIIARAEEVKRKAALREEAAHGKKLSGKGSVNDSGKPAAKGSEQDAGEEPRLRGTSSSS